MYVIVKYIKPCALYFIMKRTDRIVVDKKRNARSNVLIDEDDFIILYNLSKCVFMNLSDLKKSLNFSHKGLLIHLNRLISFELITLGRTEPNHKVKFVAITQLGKKIFNDFYSTSCGGSLINKHFLNSK